MYCQNVLPSIFQRVKGSLNHILNCNVMIKRLIKRILTICSYWWGEMDFWDCILGEIFRSDQKVVFK